MSPPGLLVVAALALLPLASRAAPITEPLVFDFEDGLQGWELHGSAQRVQTQLLGGEWAIFGDGFLDGFASIQIPLDTNVVPALQITFDVLLVDGEGRVSSAVGLRPITVSGISTFEAAALLTWSTFPVVALVDNVRISPVPEPLMLVLVMLAGGALVGLRFRA